MKTAGHYTYSGPGRVCISRGAPRGAPGGYKMFKALAPTREILALGDDQEAYRARYRAEVLDILNPRETWDALHRLTGGVEPVLQCFESPPFTACNWCHRRMVADWFLHTLGEVVDELTPETREQRAEHAAARLRASARPNTLGRSSATPLRPMVEAIRAEIDRFWIAVLARIGLTRTWSWMGRTDEAWEAMTSAEQAEWLELQARYRWVDLGQ